MKNPYDIYNDNRAYQGYKRGVSEALDELVKRCSNCTRLCPYAEDNSLDCFECVSKQIKEEVNEK